MKEESLFPPPSPSRRGEMGNETTTRVRGGTIESAKSSTHRGSREREEQHSARSSAITICCEFKCRHPVQAGVFDRAATGSREEDRKFNGVCAPHDALALRRIVISGDGFPFRLIRCSTRDSIVRIKLFLPNLPRYVPCQNTRLGFTRKIHSVKLCPKITLSKLCLNFSVIRQDVIQISLIFM